MGMIVFAILLADALFRGVRRYNYISLLTSPLLISILIAVWTIVIGRRFTLPDFSLAGVSKYFLTKGRFKFFGLSSWQSSLHHMVSIVMLRSIFLPLMPCALRLALQKYLTFMLFLRLQRSYIYSSLEAREEVDQVCYSAQVP
jgi:hypothetical protein